MGTKTKINKKGPQGMEKTPIKHSQQPKKGVSTATGKFVE